jgi:hypothetical protein
MKFIAYRVLTLSLLLLFLPFRGLNSSLDSSEKKALFQQGCYAIVCIAIQESLSPKQILEYFDLLVHATLTISATAKYI